jgi:gliding motility-associated-like protein
LLSVEVDSGANPVDYSFAWYEGETTGGPSLSFTDTTASGLTEQYYTVMATHTGSGCASEASYYVPTDIPEVAILTSTTPNRKCVDPDGVLSATILEQRGYTVEWYNGTSATGDIVYTGDLVEGVRGGVYTAIAYVTNDPFCISDPVTDTLEDVLEYPAFDLRIDAPVSNCDLSNPNGQASVDNILPPATYEAFWREVASGDTVAIGLIGTGLSATDYQVTVTNTFSGCGTTDTISIIEELETVPDPIIVKINDLTSCESANGTLTASVNGNIINYEFHWYDGEEEKPTADYLGDTYEELEIGTYSVKAQNTTTGCWSDVVSAEIIDAREYPEVSVDFTSSLCEQTDGSAFLSITNGVNVDIVNWSNTQMDEYEGVSIFEIPPGDYYMEAITPMGCSSGKEFTVPTEISIFNGVSANGDGLNDLFQIDCIEYFPGNQVKIFNRGGELVFETVDYGNSGSSFEGQGNRGIYLGSEELPIGTYFYIVDLKDGTEPKTGYLELVR